MTDECPICDRVPITVQMEGTFSWRLVEKNPLFARYELLNISFRAGSEPGPHYQQIFSKLLNAKLNGKVKTKSEELEFARKLKNIR